MKKTSKQTVEIKEENSERQIKDALIKKALGFTVEEINEEYNFVEDEPVLAKRKHSKKHYPPDLSAIQLVLANLDDFKELDSLTMEQLEMEKKRLIKELRRRTHENS